MRFLRQGHPLVKMAVFSIVAAIVGTIISLWIDWFPVQASSAADDIDLLYDVLLIASVPVFVLVMAVAIYSVTAFRAKPGDLSDGEPIHGNTKLEIIWVTIPFIMVTALAVYGWVVLEDIEAKQADSLIVDVRGRQFTWDFTYPEEGGVKSNTLMLPQGRDVEFRVRTDDVLHDFWVPEFRLKTDAVPGLTTKVRLKPTRVDDYEVVCAELCGIGHSTMRQKVSVVPEGEFDAWLEKEKGSEADGGAGAAGGDMTAAGRTLFRDTGCTACHTLSDAESSGSLGPSLDNMAADAAKYGKRKGQSPEEYVKTSIETPNDFLVPNFEADIMPGGYKESLSSEEIDTLVKYLLAVGGGKK